MGPWHTGRWYRPLARLSVLGCGLLIVVGVQPPNDIALWIVGGCVLTLVPAVVGAHGPSFSGTTACP